MARLPVLRRLLRDNAGSTVIETALVMPVLLAMSLGTFDISRIIARQSELQKAANEAGDITLAAKPTTQARQATLKSVIMTSTGLPDSNVVVGMVYRCGSDATFVADPSGCPASTRISTFVQVTLTDNVAPFWTQFGLGSQIPLTVRRQVQLS